MYIPLACQYIDMFGFLVTFNVKKLYLLSQPANQVTNFASWAILLTADMHNVSAGDSHVPAVSNNII